MATRPTDAYINDNARTQGDVKAELELHRDFMVQNPGGNVESELTIAAGSVTADRGAHSVDTESDAASDDLTNIVQTNLPEGSWLLIRQNDATRVVTVKNAAGGAGQIVTMDGADVSLGDVAGGMLLQRRSTNWNEVLRGRSNSQVEGNKKLLKTYTVNNQASLDITSVLSAAYKEYELRITNLTVATNDAELHLLMSINNGSSWINTGYQYANQGRDAGGSAHTADSAAGGTTIIKLTDGTANEAISNAAGMCFNGWFNIINPSAAATLQTHIFGKASYPRAGGANALVMLDTAGRVAVQASAINALQLKADSGNLLTGTVKVYGLV